MSEIKDFHCTYDNSVGINEVITKKLELKFPEAYLHSESMVKIAKALKEYDGACFCEMPFCHTVEAEAMGGSVNYGDGKTGPRAKEYICNSLEEILELPEIDFSKGRIREVLNACKELRESGEQVVLEISGPFTVLNVLIDVKYVFRGFRKNPELVYKVFEKIGNELLRFVDEAKTCGVNMISYADSSGSVSIIGPKMAEQVVNNFTYDFLKRLEEKADENLLILLCPKTTFALLGTEKARFVDVQLEKPMRYGQACVEMIGKTKFAGQMCIKNIDYMLENGKFKAVELL